MSMGKQRCGIGGCHVLSLSGGVPSVSRGIPSILRGIPSVPPCIPRLSCAVPRFSPDRKGRERLVKPLSPPVPSLSPLVKAGNVSDKGGNVPRKVFHETFPPGNDNRKG